MVRGSVPVFWTQPGYKYRPPPIIEKGDTHMSAIYVPRLSHTSVVKYTIACCIYAGEEETQAAFRKHFEEQLGLYQQQVIT